MHNDNVLILDEMGQANGRVLAECAYMLANGQGKDMSYLVLHMNKFKKDAVRGTREFKQQRKALDRLTQEF